MFTCKYCGVHYQTFHSICLSCGAPLKEDPPKKTEAQILVDRIRLVCERYSSRDFKEGELISDRRIATLRKSFRIFPEGKEILLYCDATPLRTGKRGFLISEDGLYWQNTWTTPTNRNFLNWDNLKRREITLKKFDLDLGKGDVIDLSGLGDTDLREVALKILKHVQEILLNNSPDKSG